MKIILYKSACLLLMMQLLLQPPALAQKYYQPADPQMIEVAQNMLKYFNDIYQHKTMGAMRGPSQALVVQNLTGKYPAMVEEDLTGWHPTAWSPTYSGRVQDHIDNIKDIWLNKKAIPGLCWHWGNPLTGGGTYDASKEELTAEQFNHLVTPGTEENLIMMEDLKKHADYLQQLTDANIPLIWRPLHEIDGGWFWWTDENNPANTVKLWQIMYNYLVNEREMHNLIWVYSAGVGNPKSKDLLYRQSYYPGDEWVDMVGIDLYGWDFRNTGIKEYWNGTESYQDAFNIMESIAPEKLVILTETEALPNMQKTYNDDDNFAKWLWVMPWYAGNEQNPDDWIKQTYTHAKIIMQPDLPDFNNYKLIAANDMTNKNLDLAIYPNPVSSSIQIHPQGNYDLQVFNLYGKSIKIEKNSPTIIVDDLVPGIYFLEILDDDERVVRKFIME